MGFSLEKVVPWGRSEDEYKAMFGLTESDRDLRILGCGDGPAAFNSDWSRRGGRVISCDPLYSVSPFLIEQRINETFALVLDQLDRNRADYLWETIPSVRALGETRMQAMRNFLTDFEDDAGKGRYVAGALPHLPFVSHAFDLALTSHLLFLYSDQLDVRFHYAAITEMLRVAREVRIFPVLKLDGSVSPYLEEMLAVFSNQGYQAQLCTVDYEFQRDGNQMLRVNVVEPGAKGEKENYA